MKYGGSLPELSAVPCSVHHGGAVLNRYGQTFIACIVLYFAGARSVLFAATQEPFASRGVIETSSLDQQEDMSLKGEWRFFLRQLVEPEQLSMALAQDAHYLKVPGEWNGHKDPATQEPMGGLGYGTYLLRVNGLSRINQPGLLMTFAASSYKLWVLDAADPARILLSLTNGVVGTSSASSISQYDTRLERFEGAAGVDSVFILIQVANFSWIHGGLFAAPVINRIDVLKKDHESTKILNVLLLGIVIIIGLYNLSLFAHRREDIGSLYLALFCFAMSIIAVRRIPNFVYTYFEVNEQNHWIFRSVFFVANPVLVASFNSFVRANFPKQSFQSFAYFCWIWSGLIAIPLVLMQTSIPITIFRLYQYLGLISAVIVLVQIFRAFWQREEGSTIAFLGSAILVASFLNDYLILYKVREGVSVLPYGIALFVLFQSQIVAIRFTKAFHQSERLGRELKKEVDRQTRDIKSVLKNIKQGIFTLVHPSKQAGEQYSDHLRYLLGQEAIAGQTIDQLLLQKSDLSSDRKNQIESALDVTLGEGSLAFEMNEANFVKELGYHRGSEKAIFEVDWNPVVNRHDEVEKILVSLRDVTEVRRLRSLAEQSENDIKVLIELVQIPEEKVQRFLTKASQYIAENRAVIQQKLGPQDEQVRRLFMNMHTIKGAARTYSFKILATAAHDVEQHYAALQRREVEWDVDGLSAELEHVHGIIRHYQEIGVNRLGWNRVEKIVKLPKAELERDLQLLQSIESKGLSVQQKEILGRLAERLSSLCYDPLSALIEEAARGLDSIARDLKKEMPVIVVPEERILVKEKAAEFLHSILLHLFRNTMDHGIESPELRQQQGKIMRGTIAITLQVQPKYVVLGYEDDGNGLDLLAIQARGIEQGLVQVGQSLTDLELASLIFISGFSTKNAVSEISGRGVGLDAVNTYCQDVGVSISIKIRSNVDRSKVPFSFELLVPREFFVMDYKLGAELRAG